ncbi:tautomerase family protein [Methanobacterium paludis]|uniref:4-oxalocrotonate tautomerase n=1 Tax=Methanobacterium paludis (strain DSM 25820 / JCM 18151 / SWAN1) TaxID=868131 RepID=F6D7T6_METPW|nr:tautomerase family protein [Methanobacterium paludis]AEG17774.1 4-oxalocrotonate tautomerase [Methanobacterium paludis]
MCPLVKIEILKGKSEEYKKAILNGVHNALVEAFGIPEDDRFQRIYELSEDNLEYPPNRTDNVTLIEATILKGRSLKAKKELYTAIVKNLAENPGITSSDITIILLEPPLENWGVRGGKPGSEVDFGFKIDV